ncbi:MAG: hypothetical protein N3D78_02965 [Candidatus Aenigmarchaeota archaeon]|nr:hypothetical protein [Candidatus Aenigmarchaeota archaeon]
MTRIDRLHEKLYEILSSIDGFENFLGKKKSEIEKKIEENSYIEKIKTYIQNVDKISTTAFYDLLWLKLLLSSGRIGEKSLLEESASDLKRECEKYEIPQNKFFEYLGGKLKEEEIPKLNGLRKSYTKYKSLLEISKMDESYEESINRRLYESILDEKERKEMLALLESDLLRFGLGASFSYVKNQIESLYRKLLV